MSHPTWYSIHTRPGKEDLVTAHLSGNLGLETYYPQFRLRQKSRGRMRTFFEPVFPRYLFCRLPPTISHRAVHYAPNAVGIVRIGDRPAAIPDHVIAELKAWAETHQFEPPKLSPGSRVKFTGGPLAGLEAIFEHYLDAHERVALLISMMDTFARATADLSELEIIS